ncbi:MAG: hypothetical protein QM765_02105 [Myxococcales bacterium]
MRTGRALALSLLLLAPEAARGQGANAFVGEREGLDTGVIVGRVCEDRDGDSTCSSDEPGIARARVVLSDGTYATTDAQGRYHVAAVPSRRAEISETSIREFYGRVLVKLDMGSLGRAGTPVGGPRRVVETTPAALNQVDFAVKVEAASGTELQKGPRRGPTGEVVAGAFLFHATGQTTPGRTVRVSGVAATVDEAGVFRADVPLKPGGNFLTIAVEAPHGELVLYRQQVSVVTRHHGGFLFVPQDPRRIATVSLPELQSAPAARVRIPVQATPEAEIEIASQKAIAGLDGTAAVEVELQRGENALLVKVSVPDEPPVEDTVQVVARGLSVVSGLLSVELSYDFKGGFDLSGRGSATVQQPLGDFDLAFGIDLDSGDVQDLFGLRTNDETDNPDDQLPADPLLLFRPREPLAIERALDPERHPPVFGDDGTTGAFNPSGSRLWALLRHPRFGELRLGGFHADYSGVEVGRYERSLFGAQLDAHVPIGPVTINVQGHLAPPFPRGGEIPAAPAHDELSGTGGSLFFLRHGSVVPGSEKLRVELRDGATGLPLDERVLERYRDYDIDFPSGRILLAQPLPMASGGGPLLATPLQAHRPTLIVDYEYRSLEGERLQAFGGKAGLSVGRYVELGVSAVKERRFDASPDETDYLLLGARGRGRVGPVTLAAEVAQSEGTLFAPTLTGGFNASDTGGLSFLSAPAMANANPARAWSVRASVSEEMYGAQLWARGRDAGFSDGGAQSNVEARQVGGLVRLSLGRFELAARYDDRLGSDPRDPFSGGQLEARDGSLRGSGRFGDLTVLLEASYGGMQLPEETEQSGRLGVGARLDYAITRELSVNASYQQRVWSHGGGLAARDDTFAAVGATWRPKDDLGFSVRGGWGPGVGTQVQVGVERAGEGDVSYGYWSSDVDGPGAGQMVAVSGARRRLDERSDVFVEDLFARDVDSLRTGRAVGLSYAPTRSLTLSARYERGTRLLFTGVPGFNRDSGSARVAWLVSGVRLSGLAEVRRERGASLAEKEGGVDRWQTVGGASLDARPLPYLSLGARLLATKTRNRGVDETFALEGYAGASLRLEPFVLLASYSIVDRAPALPQSETSGTELVHLVALRPSVVLFDRLRIGAGIHGAFYRTGGTTAVLAGSIRGAVRIVGGLEAAAEYSRRSSAPEGEALDAFRVEAAYWFDQMLGVALGYNLHGYSGDGVDPRNTGSDRVYLRLEAAY